MTTTTLLSSSSNNFFWNDAAQVSKLEDPPPLQILRQIQERPWKGGFEPVSTHGIDLHEAQILEGTIPKDLQGTLYRNGSGRIRIGNHQYGHWFDGDGLVTSLHVNGKTQKATYKAKYVETERFQAQQRFDSAKGFATSGAWTKRGTGQIFQNLFAIPTNPSNTNILHLEGSSDKIYALAEGGPPIEMNPTSLESLGERSFKSDSFFSAHYKKDPHSGEIYNHGLILLPTPTINLMKLDGNGNLLQQKKHRLPNFGFVHDNILSENNFIVVIQPYEAPSFALLTSLIGGEPVGKQLLWNPQKQTHNVAMIFSKETLECVAKVEIPLVSTYHNLNAYEGIDGTGKVVLKFRTLAHDPSNTRIDVEKCFADPYSAIKVPTCPTIYEYTIDVAGRKLISCQDITPAHGFAPCELPDCNDSYGYDTRYIYTNTQSNDDVEWSDSIQKLDLKIGECSSIVTFGEGVHAGAPIFVSATAKDPKLKEEDDGYICTQLFRSKDHGTDVCILDAKSMQKLCTLRLSKPVPYQFHGTWIPSSSGEKTQ